MKLNSAAIYFGEFMGDNAGYYTPRPTSHEGQTLGVYPIVGAPRLLTIIQYDRSICAVLAVIDGPTLFPNVNWQ